MQISESEHVLLGLEEEARPSGKRVGQPLPRAEGGGLVVGHQGSVVVFVVEAFLTSGGQFPSDSGVLVHQLGRPQSVDRGGLVRDDPVDQPDPLPARLAPFELRHVEFHVLVRLRQLQLYRSRSGLLLPFLINFLLPSLGLHQLWRVEEIPEEVSHVFMRHFLK